LTKLDDLREFIRNKNKKPLGQEKNSNQEEKFSLEVAGSEATTMSMKFVTILNERSR
jgi:hypothetical protein